MTPSTEQLDATYIAPTYARFPVEIVSGKGAMLTDAQGKQYIDMGTGIAVNTFGVADQPWIDAVTAQLALCQHTSNLFYSAPCARLAEALCARTGMARVFFSNSGAEANECAIKVARRYAALHHGTDTYTILTLRNSFHGRTLTTLAATGQDAFHQDFLPLTPGFVYADAGDTDGVRRLLDEHRVAGILMEMVQGEGGVLPLDPAFVTAVAQMAAERDILVMCDEVQCGNGRSGSLYAYMQYGITPDVVSTAKGLGGGLPIGATLLGPRVRDVLTPGSHGSTFGGNPVACAGALSILSRLDDALLSDVRRKSAQIFATLTGAPGVRSVTGLGLMIGVETEADAGAVLAEARARGVIAIRAKNKVRLLPPLNIPDKELEQALTVLKEACAVAASAL